MVATVPQFGPSDLLSSPVEGLRRVKVSSFDGVTEFSLDGMAYSITGAVNLTDGQAVALNITPAAKSIINRVSTNIGNRIGIYSEFATGTSNGEFKPKNINLTSIDQTSTTCISIIDATPAGDQIASMETYLEPDVIVGPNTTPSVVIYNDSGANQDVIFSVLLLEIGPRAEGFGLTPSTQIIGTTEMSDYG